MILVTLQHFVQAGGFAAVPNVLTAEALVAKEGLELAVECGVYKTILEVHCSELKAGLESNDGTRSSISFRFDISGLAILELFGCVGIANSVAHSCDCVGSD